MQNLIVLFILTKNRGVEHKECKGKYYNPNHAVGELELVLETDFPGKKGRDKRH